MKKRRLSLASISFSDPNLLLKAFSSNEKIQISPGAPKQNQHFLNASLKRLVVCENISKIIEKNDYPNIFHRDLFEETHGLWIY